MKRVVCAADMNSIYNKVYEDLRYEPTKLGKQAFDVLDKEGIADIISNGTHFWFEFYSRGNDCPQSVYDYLKRFIKRKYRLKYLYDDSDRHMESVKKQNKNFFDAVERNRASLKEQETDWESGWDEYLEELKMQRTDTKN